MVELKNVSKRFGEFVAVAKIDLIVEAGEFLTLLGPSGCGKTTLLRMIAGFETPTEGSVHLDGRDVTAVPPNKRDVNQVFQSYALFPHLNVQDNVAFGLRVKRVPRDEIAPRVADAIKLVALTGMERRKPDQLSGGQRQRVALARALINRPKVLLLDEPLGALDAELRRTMQLELKTLQRSLGITFIFVTHDQEEALSMSDRIAVMNRGHIEQIDSAEDIYRRPTTPFVARFIGEGNVFDCTPEGERLVRLASGEQFAVLDSTDAIAVSFRTEHAVISSRLASKGSSMAGPSLAGPSLAGPPLAGTSLAVTVVEKIFRGSSDLLQLKTAGGLVVRSSAEPGRWTRGDVGYLSVAAADLIVLRKNKPMN